MVLDEKQQFKVYISPKVIERFKHEIAINRETISRGLISQPQCIPEKHLIQAISTLRGTDKRTIFKWIRILKQYKVIKESGVHEYEFLSFITIDSQEHYSDGKPR